MITGPRIVYTVDDADRISSVNAAWSDFARRNDGGALLQPTVIGQRLFDSISDATSREVYRAILKRVRRGAEAVRFNVRCDAPGRRRLLEMNIASAGHGAVTFSASPLAEEDRATMALLDPNAPRSDSIVTVCGWCMRLRLTNGTWVELEEGVDTLAFFEANSVPQLSHGMCPSCFDAMDRALDAETKLGETVVGLTLALPTG